MNSNLIDDDLEESGWGIRDTIGGALAALLSMYGSRFWLAILPLGLVTLLVLGLPLVAGVVGQFWPRPGRLVSVYKGLAEKESRDFLGAQSPGSTVEGDQSDAESGLESELVSDQLGTSAFGELLSRRLLQLEDETPSVQMTLALKLAHAGELAQARLMLAEVAPPEGGGYPPGHAWLAMDLLERESQLSADEQQELAVHLAEAERWTGTGPTILAAYARMLVKRGEGKQAVVVLERAVKQDPSLRVLLTAIPSKEGDQLRAEESGMLAEADLLQRIEAGEATGDDFFNLAQLMLIRQEPQRCLEYVERGLATKPANPQLYRRLGSNALLFQFQQSAKAASTGGQLNLELLDAALKADPSNPALSGELARALSYGVQLPEESDRQLNEYLASGKATALLHFIIAERAIAAGKLSEALKHLEIANQLAPGSPVIMNNLAVILMLVDKNQLERSLELIEECLQTSGLDAEFLDSKGQILLLGGKPLQAIAMLEQAIELAPERLDTRTNLIEAYRQAGLDELAALQAEKREALRRSQAEGKPGEADK